MIARHSHREVTASHRLQCLKQFLRKGALFPLPYGLVLARRRVDGVTEPTSLMAFPSCSKARPIAGAGELLFRTIKSCEQSGSKKDTLYYSLLDR